MSERSLETRRGIKFRVRELGTGAPLLFLHGAGGLAPEEPLLTTLAERFHVFAPLWPGFGEEPGEELLEDMLDSTWSRRWGSRGPTSSGTRWAA
jgi:pimeloyl-ACP methyl ester carboxylesterase